MSLKIDFTLDASKGYQLSTDVMQEIQDDRKRIEESLTLLAGGTANGTILKGLTNLVVGLNVTFDPGYFTWNGQIVVFAGGTVAVPGGGVGDVLFTITETATNLTFCDTSTNLAYTLVTGTLENGGTTGDIKYDDMHACKNICELEEDLDTTNGTVSTTGVLATSNKATLDADVVANYDSTDLTNIWNAAITLATLAAADPSEFTTTVLTKSILYKDRSGKIYFQGELEVTQITFGASTDVKVLTINAPQLSDIVPVYPSTGAKIFADYCIFDDGTNYEQLELFIERSTGLCKIAGKSSSITSTVLASGRLTFKFSYYANDNTLIP